MTAPHPMFSSNEACNDASREHALTVSRLAESEAWFSGVVNSALDAIIIGNAFQQITLFNPAAERLFGFTRDEALRMSLSQILPDWARLVAVESGSLPENTPVAMPQVLSGWHRDGSQFPVEVAVSQTHVEGHPIFTAVVRDITERLRAEETLHLSVSAIQACTNSIVLVEASEGKSALSREDYPIVAVNPAFERITGYTSAEVLGRNCRFLQGTDRDQPERERLRTALANGEAVTVTLRNYRKDGTLYFNELHISPVCDPSGHITHYVGIQSDVTERIQAAERQRTFLREVLYSVTEGRLRLCDSPNNLPPLPGAADPIGVVVLRSPAELGEVRREVRTAGHERGFPDERWMDVMSAASECAMNALQHGGGPATVQIYSDEEGSKLQIRVTDKGTGIDMAALPRATLMKGHSGGGGFGHGFFLMLRSVDAVNLLTGPEGTTVVLEQNRQEPEPEFY